MKPNAPDGMRSDFKPIATSVPGSSSASTCRAWPPAPTNSPSCGRWRTRNLNHLNATHHLLTGHPQPGAFFDKIASRTDFPNYASALDYLRPRSTACPAG
jgi:hypothetical protein